MHKGGGSSYYGRVRKFDATGREVSVRRCDEREFHVHRTPTAAVKCANKVAR